MRGSRVSVLVFAFLSADPVAFAQPAFTLLGGTGGGSPSFTLVEIDLEAATVTQRGGSDFWTGLEVSPDRSVLYGIGSELDVIDPADGAQTEIGPLTYNDSAPILMRSASMSPAGQLYVLSNQFSDPAGVGRMFTVDLSTGDLTLVGTPTAIIFGIEFAPNGTLYAAFASLYEINPANAATNRLVGSLGGGAFVTELDWTPQGALLGVDPLKGSRVYDIDPDGSPSSLGTLLASFKGVEVRSLASIPEPGSLWFVLAALGVLGAKR